MDDPVLSSRGHIHAQQGDHYQQEREDGEEPVVGDERRLRPGGVITELLHHAEQEVQGKCPLLKCIKSPDAPLNEIHLLVLVIRRFRGGRHGGTLPRRSGVHSSEYHREQCCFGHSDYPIAPWSCDHLDMARAPRGRRIEMIVNGTCGCLLRCIWGGRPHLSYMRL